MKNEDSAYVEAISRDLSENHENTRSWLFWQKEGWNIAIFSSGWGDGFYASYIGYDADGNICRFVTDFNILTWPDPSKSSLRIV